MKLHILLAVSLVLLGACSLDSEPAPAAVNEFNFSVRSRTGDGIFNASYYLETAEDKEEAFWFVYNKLKENIDQLPNEAVAILIDISEFSIQGIIDILRVSNFAELAGVSITSGQEAGSRTVSLIDRWNLVSALPPVDPATGRMTVHFYFDRNTSHPQQQQAVLNGMTKWANHVNAVFPNQRIAFVQMTHDEGQHFTFTRIHEKRFCLGHPDPIPLPPSEEDIIKLLEHECNINGVETFSRTTRALRVTFGNGNFVNQTPQTSGWQMNIKTDNGWHNEWYILHELGHVLGLSEGSSHPNFVRYIMDTTGLSCQRCLKKKYQPNMQYSLLRISGYYPWVPGTLPKPYIKESPAPLYVFSNSWYLMSNGVSRFANGTMYPDLRSIMMHNREQASFNSGHMIVGNNNNLTVNMGMAGIPIGADNRNPELSNGDRTMVALNHKISNRGYIDWVNFGSKLQIWNEELGVFTEHYDYFLPIITPSMLPSTCGNLWC